jgi:crotonobetainyl-CoA:carnitine CoA-transferase CaiB-like acyl-CoA transferase
MVRLTNRLNPTAGCYRSADGRLLMPVTTVNRKLAIRMFEELGLWERVQRLGIVDASPYDPASRAVADRNIALPQGMRADLNMQLAVWMEEAFAAHAAAEWEKLFAEAEVPCAIVQDFAEWMNCSSSLRSREGSDRLSSQSTKPAEASTCDSNRACAEPLAVWRGPSRMFPRSPLRPSSAAPQFSQGRSVASQVAIAELWEQSGPRSG